MATCPECDADIEVDDTDIEEMETGDPWDCAECNSRVRVLSLDPLEFEPDDDDDDEEDDRDEDDDPRDSSKPRYDDDLDDSTDDDSEDEDDEWDD